MPLARKRQISLNETPYYHCVSRCVRRAFLCGKDKLTGKCFEHRRQWVEDRLLFLTTVFTIDVCAYAVMSNHTHVVLHVDQKRAQQWSDKDVLEQWHKIHKGTLLSQRSVRDGEETLSSAELLSLDSTIKIYRQRLADISWFMRELNEPIARQANIEDGCTGHFWEGRFKSQALLDEHALAACMVYVDLNPIRAKMEKTPETSKHTSIKRRIADLKRGHQPKTLMPFIRNPSQHKPQGLTFDLLDYIQLVEQSGRALDPRKRGSIALDESPILKRLGISETDWELLSTAFESTFSVAAGQQDQLQTYKRRRRQAG